MKRGTLTATYVNCAGILLKGDEMEKSLAIGTREKITTMPAVLNLVYPSWVIWHWLEIFLVSTTQGHATGISWVEARNTEKHLIDNFYGNSIGPEMSVVWKLRSAALYFWMTNWKQETGIILQLLCGRLSLIDEETEVVRGWKQGKNGESLLSCKGKFLLLQPHCGVDLIATVPNSRKTTIILYWTSH